MAESSSVKDVREQDDAVIVSLAGEIDMNQTPEVHRALMSACQKKPARLVINLQDVSYMDSSGIGALVEVLRRVKAYSGKLTLCCMSERVFGVFEITKLDHFFTIKDSEQEALAE